MMKKQSLRIWVKKERKDKRFSRCSRVILAKIRKTSLYKSSQKLMIYYPLPYEIDILELMKDEKEFSFPCIRDGEIIPYKAGMDYEKGFFNIWEPKNTQKAEPEDLDLIIVPALCADKNGYRLGYGKGFYDRFIKKLNRSKTKLLVPLCDEFFVENIFPDEFDEKIDVVVTEKRTIVF